MFDMLKKGVFYNRQVMFNQAATRDALLEQHRAICDAIMARDPIAARGAVDTHMSYIENMYAGRQEGRGA